MNPPGSTEIPLEGDEDIAPQRPPYLHPIQLGVKLPQRSAKFTICTPLLPPSVQLVGMMTVKIDRLKYADHDTNDHGKFPQFTPSQYLHFVKYKETGETLLEVK